MIRARISQRYAKALFELAQQAGRIDEIGADLAAVSQVISAEPVLRDTLLSPVVTRAAKHQVLAAFLDAAGPDPLVANFLRVLLDARKLPFLPDIASTFQDMADEASGRVRGEAVAPMPLDPGDVEALSQALSRTLQKDVTLDTRQDPALLGGVIARVGNLVFDGSLRTQLQRMKETLTKG